MKLEIILRYLHFISIFTLFSTVVAEHLLLKKKLTRAEIGRLAIIDAVYGVSALTLIAAGLTLWFADIGKPVEYYNANWIFHMKVTLVVLVALMSIYPTVFFVRNRKGDPGEIVAVPKVVFRLLRVQLVLLFVIPLLAVLMARGVGSFG